MDIIKELYELVKNRKNEDPEKSYAAKLFHKGRDKISQKLGEEAVEIVIEAIKDDKKGVISESADLLFHLIMLWADMGIKPEKIAEELERRKGKSGIEEKKSRKN